MGVGERVKKRYWNILNSLECGDLSPLSPYQELSRHASDQSADRSAHSKELSGVTGLGKFNETC